MQRHPASLLFLAAALLSPTGSAAAEPAPDQQVVLISAFKPQAPPLQSQLDSKLGPALEATLEVVPFDTLKSAGSKADITRRHLHKPESLSALSSTLKLSHALLFTVNRRAASKVAEGKSPWGTAVRFLEVSSAQVLWKSVFDLPENTLTNESVQEIVTAVAAALSPAPAPETVSDLTEEPPPGEGGEDGAEKAEELVSTEGTNEGTNEGTSETTNEAIADAEAGEENNVEEATEETVNAEDGATADAVPGTSEAGELLQTAPVTTTRRPLYFSAGVGGIYRNAGLSSSATQTEVEYSTVGMVPGLILRGEAYLFDYLPLNAPALQNVALNMEATLFSVDSEEFGSSRSSDMSGKYSLEFMAHHAMAEGDNAPTLQAGLGYSHFRLPLQAASFPGTKYHSAHLAVGGAYPLPAPLPTGHRLTALAGLGYRFKVFRSGKLKRLGELDAASGLNGQLGVRTQHKQFVLTALWSYDRYKSSYKGDTRLPRPTQYKDARLTDSMHHLEFLVGYYYDVP